jgi:DNA-3-methyladenine glycosylase II
MPDRAALTAKPAYLPRAARALKAADPVLGALIAKVGPCRLQCSPQEVFPSLVASITYQQLNGKAAATIHGRVLALFDEGRALTPRAFEKTPDEKLRAAGLSGNKLLAMRDLAEKCASGVVPERARLEGLPDGEIVEKLTQVRGIGVWTAQMFLMFRLGRPDVLPAADYGIRKAFGLLYRKRAGLPPPEAVEKHGRLWAPWRTVASWYLWRSLDGDAAL